MVDIGDEGSGITQSSLSRKSRSFGGRERERQPPILRCKGVKIEKWGFRILRFEEKLKKLRKFFFNKISNAIYNKNSTRRFL